MKNYFEVFGGKDISIHAPREGSDPMRKPQRAKSANFYPRSPRGERLADHARQYRQIIISIHAPREGSDGPF